MEGGWVECGWERAGAVDEAEELGAGPIGSGEWGVGSGEFGWTAGSVLAAPRSGGVELAD